MALPLCLTAVLLLSGGVALAQPPGPRSPKIAPPLRQVLLRLEGASLSGESLATPPPEQLSTPLVRVDRRARVQVYVHVDQVDDATLADLAAAGLAVEQTAPRNRIVQGWIPFERMRDLTALTSVRRVRPPDYAWSQARTDRLTPKGDPVGSRP